MKVIYCYLLLFVDQSTLDRWCDQYYTGFLYFPGAWPCAELRLVRPGSSDLFFSNPPGCGNEPTTTGPTGKRANHYAIAAHGRQFNRQQWKVCRNQESHTDTSHAAPNCKVRVFSSSAGRILTRVNTRRSDPGLKLTLYREPPNRNKPQWNKAALNVCTTLTC